MCDQVLCSESYGNEKEIFYIKSKDIFSKTLFKVSTDDEKTCYNNKFLSIIKEVFLPQGFPASVHPDYIPYQIWDTVQAFASTIMGTLTTHSIMQGVGVGKTTTTALAAAITWILKDGTGMIGCIVFTWWKSTDLDRQCKKWRLCADILNDIAMGIELLVPYFSTYSVTMCLCVSTALKSIVGVAGGATRAALIQHQAVQNNLADVLAKDASQETCVNLIASIVGIFILSYVYDRRYITGLYLFLVVVHLCANYLAVKAVCLSTFNEDRFSLIIKNYIIHDNILDPKITNKKESIFLFGNPVKSTCGFDIKLGVSIGNLLKNNIISFRTMEDLLNQFRDSEFLLIIDIKLRTIFVLLKKDISSSDVLKACFHAYFYGIYICISQKLQNEFLSNIVIHEPTSYLMCIYLLYKTEEQSNLRNKFFPLVSMRNACFMDEVIRHEYNKFAIKLKRSEWTLQTHSLPVSGWRASWYDVHT